MSGYGGPWQPPVPSLASLPVDRTKTEPKPAYYKLQFGDDATGFSYYVRTLTVVVGRNCQRAPPPPAITSPPVPVNPPLPQGSSPGLSQPVPTVEDILNFDSSLDPSALHLPSSFAVTTDPVSGNATPEVAGPSANASPDVALFQDGASGSGSVPPDDPEVKMELEDLAPPPPPTKSSGNIEHVDVDLGPLKSVSRNHAKIEFREDMGTFCLEILGRNGAWVDDRYFVKGTSVPLNQGSQIQIATRIFSFILPPSNDASPYSPHAEDTASALEDVPYPYNLPPSEIAYAEFYGEPGPGPASAANMAARVPPPFNAFAAADGYGLGIEGMDGRDWDDEWDSDDDSDEDSYDSDSDEDGDDAPASKSAPKLKLKLTPGELQDDGSDEGDKSASKKKAGRPKKVQPAPPPPPEPVAQVQEKAGKAPAKSSKKKADTTIEVDQDSIEPAPEPASAVVDSVSSTPAKSHKKKKEGGDEKSGSKKDSKKKKAPAATVPAMADPSTAPSPSILVPPVVTLADVKQEPQAAPAVPTLAAAMAQDPLPQSDVKSTTATTPNPQQAQQQPQQQLQQPQQQPQQTLSTTPSAAGTPQPRPAQSAGSQPPLFQRADSESASIRPTPPEVPRPFYLTELKETPGRAGHIIVNVPIPPSGAGPRPPPGPLIGLDGKPFIGPPPIKPTATFATIIHRALTYLPRGRGTLGEVCNWVAGEWEWFRLNIDAGWQNSIRHNLSLNKAFLKVPRIPEDDPESKGSVWIIDPEEGPLFEEKQRRDALKSAGKEKNAEVKRERERQKIEERARKQREMALAEHAQAQAAAQSAHKPMVPRPTPLPPRPQPRANPATAISANSKGLLQPKAKITVSIQTLTAAHRAQSVIATSDASGNPLPFACDGTTLTLDQTTFGHLTGDIIDKLTLLGAAGAVDVLSAWVINKNKNQAARAAQQAAQAQASANAKPSAAQIKAGLTGGRPIAVANGNNVGAGAGANSGPKPAVGAKPPIKPAAPGAAPGGPPTKGLPGPAPPGASLTKVIGMIAEVANAKGDVNTVGPNASALLRYIRVVGVDIDLRVAERIWATGVVPPLPKKGPAATLAPRPASATLNANSNGTAAKPAGSAPAAQTNAASSAAPAVAAAAPAPTAASSLPAATPAPVNPAVKRKLEGQVGNGPAGDEAKRPKVEV